MEYLFPLHNRVRDAALSMTNVVPSNAIERTDEAAKVGGGNVRLTGPYTGAVDIAVDVQIVDTTIEGEPSISAPAFSGVGNGQMTAITAADGMTAETYTITLEDLGTETRRAEAPFQNVVLRAKAAGEGGNAITVTVVANLTTSPTDYALREPLQQGATALYGDFWNFGAAPLTPEGNVPATAPRIRIGDDPQVYRAWRQYDFDRREFKYGFSPSPVRTVAAGGRVRSVTGNYTVTITDGVTPESYSGITLYEILNAIRSGSALVEVVGAIINDAQPGGQAATDLSLYTSSYCASIVRDGSDEWKRADLGLVVGEDAPTETLQITCVGGIEFDVRGDVTGPLPRAIAGVLYDSSPYQFQIPLPATAAEQTGVQMLIDLELQPREGGPVPALCPPLGRRFGPNVRNGTYRWRYQAKPPAACECSDIEMDAPPSEECVGDETNGGEMATNAAIARRVERGSRLLREFALPNTPLYSARTADLNHAQRAVGIALKCLQQLGSGTLEYPARQNSHVYERDEMIQVGDQRYACSIGGTSDASAPAFNAAVDATTTDGGVTWVSVGPAPLQAWDAMLEQIKDDISPLINDTGPVAVAETWVASTAVVIGKIIQPTVPNGRTYFVERDGTTGGTEPTWPTTTGATVTSGGAVFRDRGPYWQASHEYAAGFQTVIPGIGLFEVLTAGESGASQPVWSYEVGREVADGAAAWVQRSIAFPAPNLSTDVTAMHYRRYEALANEVLAAAGIVGNFDKASGGDGCWQEDTGQTHWFVYVGADEPPYMPVQVGHWYVASRPGQDADGNEVINSTHEFAFEPRISCPENLVEGDEIVVTITGVNGVTGGYQQGDQALCFVTHGAPLAFGGGQTGNDTLTFSVVGSESGRLDDYALLTTAPVPYADGGLGFLITPGGIKFALGDRFEFSLEGGHFRWRVDGGAWEATAPIAPTVALSDGLSAVFAGGRPPSWAAGDTWSFLARALSGISNARDPDDSVARWIGSTAIIVEPVGAVQVGDLLLIGEHEIPSDATITLAGSNDDFATVEFSLPLAWRGRNIIAEIPDSCVQYRISVDRGGGAQWLFLGPSLQLATARNGVRELGRLTAAYTLPSALVRGGLGGSVSHEAVSDASFAALLAALDDASQAHGRRLGIVPNRAEGAAALVRYADDSIPVEDLLGFQPSNPAHRWLNFRLALEPAA